MMTVLPSGTAPIGGTANIVIWVYTTKQSRAMPAVIKVFFIRETPVSDSVYALNDAEPAVFKIAGTEDIGGRLVAAVGRVAHRGVTKSI
ncbi:hypothetical protein D3C75_1210990 [compost metagenome]